MYCTLPAPYLNVLHITCSLPAPDIMYTWMHQQQYCIQACVVHIFPAGRGVMTQCSVGCTLHVV
jgi:hypothetical protein